jgi:hypothetical protein
LSTSLPEATAKKSALRAGIQKLDIEAKNGSTGALVVVKEFTLNRCPFR